MEGRKEGKKEGRKEGRKKERKRERKKERKKKERKKEIEKPGVVAHACNPSTWEAETGGSMFVASLSYLVRPSAT